MWDLTGPGIKPVSPALAGRLSTTAPPGKPLSFLLPLLPTAHREDPGSQEYLSYVINLQYTHNIFKIITQVLLLPATTNL